MSNKTIYGATPVVGTDNKFHYVYRITNIVEGKHYYGARSCKINPYKDLGSKYFSSISNKENGWIRLDQKKNPQNYKYKILAFFSSREKALKLEVNIHRKFNVKKHVKFYNGVNQTSSGFDTTGKIVVYDKDKDLCFLVDLDDQRFKSRELEHPNTGFGVYRDDKNQIKRVSTKIAKASNKYTQISVGYSNYIDKNTGKTIKAKTTDKRIKTGEIIPFFTGRAQYIELKTGKIVSIETSDERIKTGEFISIMSGKSIYKNKFTGKIILTSTDDPRVLQGEFVGVTMGKSVYKDRITGETIQLDTTDPLVLSGSVVSINAGMSMYISKITGDAIRTCPSDPRVLQGEFVGHTIGKSQYINKITGEKISTNKSDPRVLQGEFVQVNLGRNKGLKRSTDEFGKTRYT